VREKKRWLSFRKMRRESEVNVAVGEKEREKGARKK